MPKVSVIIPVYNVEEYLRECLDSVVNQTLKDIEIICVNDGSTDNSLAILNEYEQKDCRVKIIDKKNEGAGPARNVGMKISTGDYLIFFDADDCMKNDALEVLYANVTETNSDISLCRSMTFSDNVSDTTDISWSIKDGLIDNKTSFHPAEVSKYIFQFCVGWPWDKLYRRDFVIKNELYFQSLRHSNDTYFVLMSLVLASKISRVDDRLMFHRKHANSLEATRVKAPKCFYYALREMLKTLKKKNLYKLYEQSFVNYCINFACWHIGTIEDTLVKDTMINYYNKILRAIDIFKFDQSYFYDVCLYNKSMNEYLKKHIIEKFFKLGKLISDSNERIFVKICGIKIKFPKRKILNNFVIIDNKLCPLKNIKDINIKFLGENNRVIIKKNSKLINCIMELGSNNVVEIGENCHIKDEAFLVTSNNCIIKIGNYTNLHGGMLSLRNKENTKIIIGNRCLFSSDVSFRTSDGHTIYDLKTKNLLNPDENIVVEDNVWIGHGVSILKNVHIVKNVVIGTESVVTKNLMTENSIYAGVPAQLIKSDIGWITQSPDKYINQGER